MKASDIHNRQCPYCGHVPTYWSEWSSRTVICTCGKKVSIKELMEPHCDPPTENGETNGNEN